MTEKFVDNTPKKQLPEVLEKNKWKKGQSGNPNGRPKGSGLSLATLLKRKLEDVPEGAKKTYAELLIDRILQMAIQDKNDQQIKNILQYIEGMPRGSETNINFDNRQVVFKVEYTNDNQITQSTNTNSTKSS